ncbi:MAG: acyl-ACP desaturase [Ignavibacteriae bacterium]|nr:acyl-ACP desaturase [Ignavibacteriota bacterium]
MTIGNTVEVNSQQLEVIKSMEGFVRENVGTLLKPVEESWQPTDFLPDFSKEDWHEQVTAFRETAKELPDDVLVVLVGDMITEEALPSYQTWLNRLHGVTDSSGIESSGWAQWSRGWTAEENRHGDLLNKYLYLTGRVDMRSIETSIHNLINSGFDPQTENDPYLGFIYTSFQERATKISHRNVGVMAKKAGEDRLHKICGLIAGDEARHEKAYKLFMTKVFEVDPAGGMLAFAKMMRKKITMPAVLMHDGQDRDLFSKFSMVAQKIGVYTAHHYAEIIENLVRDWKVASINGLSDAAAKAQEYVCTLGARYKKLAERMKFSGTFKFSWIFDRDIDLDILPPQPEA